MFSSQEQAMRQALIRFVKDEAGTETLEWGLVCGLIVVAGITAIAAIGPKLKTLWTNSSTAISAAPSTP
jgi:Flp pilus assembly pilin Flp